MYHRRRRLNPRVFLMLGYPVGFLSLLVILALILTPVVMMLKLIGLA